MHFVISVNITQRMPSSRARFPAPHPFMIIVGFLRGLRALCKTIEDGIRALEQIIRLGTMFVIPSDRYDTSTFSSVKIPYMVYLYENVPGGIGIAEKAFSVWREACEEGIRIAERCDCKDGCPRCIFPPRLKETKGMSKQAGLRLARKILEITEEKPTEELDPTIHGWKAIV